MSKRRKKHKRNNIQRTNKNNTERKIESIANNRKLILPALIAFGLVLILIVVAIVLAFISM